VAPRPDSDELVSSDYNKSIYQIVETKPPTSTLKKTLIFFRNPGKLASSIESSRSKARVTRVLNLIHRLSNSDVESDKKLIDKHLIKRKITSIDYEQLLARVASDKSLQGYFNNKLQ
jgi:hypothetical protein